MQLAKAIGFRLAFGLLSLLFITLVTFVASQATPIDPATIFAGEKATSTDIARIRHKLGLDRPWYVQYGDSLVNDLHFNFGRSYYGTQEQVSSILERDLPMTIRLSIISIIAASFLGLLLGTFAALYENRFVDRSVLTISTLGVTLPNFVLAPLLVLFFCLYLDRLPQNWEANRIAPDYYYYILPVICLAARPMAQLTRLTRASMVDTMQQEFIRLAVAKGVPTYRLVVRHALRNAILPVITAIGNNLGYLLTGSLVVETFFILPGIGRETILAIQKGDFPVVQACILVTGSMFVIINMAVDLILPFLDPRIREAQV